MTPVIVVAGVVLLLASSSFVVRVLAARLVWRFQADRATLIEVARMQNTASFQRAMMRLVRPNVGKLLAATLLVLCIGVQVLEASGHWDRALKDSNDEAIIVVVVLCIGAALGAAGAVLARVRPERILSQIVLAGTSPSIWSAPRLAISSSCASPPVSLRI